MILSRSPLVVLCALASMGGLSTAQETPAKKKAVGPLAALPSAPGPHLSKIQALGDNAWLKLGSPAPDPKWGKGRGRSWSARMAFAPELRGAFLSGEGVHGFVKPDGYYMDDFFFYDINAHRWICIYPGMHVESFEKRIKEGDLKTDGDGVIVDKEARPVPFALLAHGYEALTYDPDSRRLVVMDGEHGEWRTVEPLVRGMKLLGKTEFAQGPARPRSPYFYNTLTAQWERHPVEGTRSSFNLGSVFVYVPTRKQFFFDNGGHDVHFFEPAARRWTPVETRGRKPPFGIDPTACYDSRRDRIYMGGGDYPPVPEGSNAFWIFDLRMNSWIDPQPAGRPCKGSNAYGTRDALMNYDSVNDAVILIRHLEDGGRKGVGVYVYDPAANAWSALPGDLPSEWGRGEEVPLAAKSGFYDPVLNVVFVHAASDSEDDGVLWAYRYRRVRK